MVNAGQAARGAVLEFGFGRVAYSLPRDARNVYLHCGYEEAHRRRQYVEDRVARHDEEELLREVEEMICRWYEEGIPVSGYLPGLGEHRVEKENWVEKLKRELGL